MSVWLRPMWDGIVRAPEDKAALANEETYEDFHPTFTYPVRQYH
jgi:hypothetical protein